MTKQSQLFVIVSIIVFSILNTGDALKCYVCNSKENVNCTENPPSKDVVENCSTGYCGYLFISSEYVNGNHSITKNITERNCVHKNFCEDTKQMNNLDFTWSIIRLCYKCNKDLCNNAHVISPIAAILKCTILLWVVQYIVYKF